MTLDRTFVQIDDRAQYRPRDVLTRILHHRDFVRTREYDDEGYRMIHPIVPYHGTPSGPIVVDVIEHHPCG